MIRIILYRFQNDICYELTMAYRRASWQHSLHTHGQVKVQLCRPTQRKRPSVKRRFAPRPEHSDQLCIEASI